MGKVIGLTIALSLLTTSGAALANGVGENTSWQFQTTAELANRAYLEDLRRKQQSGFYNAPIYYIENQNNFNCSNAANASGNGGTNTATANTPSSSGASGSAIGSQNTSSVSSLQTPYSTVLNNAQENWGFVGSGVTGDSLASALGNLTGQALNTFQNNRGIQDASINGSSACAFASVTGVAR